MPFPLLKFILYPPILYEAAGCWSATYPSMRGVITYLGVGHLPTYLARGGHLCVHFRRSDIPFHFIYIIYLSIKFPTNVFMKCIA